MSAPTSTHKSAMFWLAVLRMMIGLMFVTTWVNNLLEGFYTPEGFLRFFSESYPQSANPLTWYAAFINGVILPIRGVFAPFQMVAELIMGIALVAGFLTPLFSLAGIFFLINTFLATFGHDWYWSYLMPIVILAVVLISRAGREKGIDSSLARRFGEKWWW